MDCELLIAGQGLAGTLLAWEAHWAGLRVAIIDPDETETASKVAAGIINPITGHRLTRSWRFDEFYPIAIEFYKRVERELDRSFYHSRSILRCLDNGRAARLWRRRAERADYRHLWSDDAHLVRSLDCGWFQPSDARFATQRCGNLEVEAFLESSRRFFSAQHRVLSEALDPAAIEMPEAESGVRYRGLSARHAVLCLGEKGRDVRFFGHLSLRRAKGEVLELELADCREDRIINRGGKWLLPTGGGRFLAGATYNWDPQEYDGGRNFGHLAYVVDDIHELCQSLLDNGVTINRPPRDGHMAFVRSPDGISIELLQKGQPLEPVEPWLSMKNTGSW